MTEKLRCWKDKKTRNQLHLLTLYSKKGVLIERAVPVQKLLEKIKMRKIKCKPVFAGRFTRGTFTKRHLARSTLSDHPMSPLKKLRSIAKKKLEPTTTLNENIHSNV